MLAFGNDWAAQVAQFAHVSAPALALSERLSLFGVEAVD
jgi:hypothetical protein